MKKPNAIISFAWMWLCGIVWAVVMIFRSAILNLGVMDAALSAPIRLFIAILVQTLVLASILGVAQWALIRGYLAHSGRWILRTVLWGTIGLLLGYLGATLVTFPIADILLAPDASSFGLERESVSSALALVLFLIQGVMGGAIIGLAQRGLLNEAFIGTGRWIFANAVSFGIASLVWSLLISMSVPDAEIMSELNELQAALVRLGGDGVSGFGGGFANGMILGWTLSTMELRDPETQPLTRTRLT